MSMPGWYPDPGGAQGHFRWWDGRGWSVETTPDPRSPAPAGTAGPAGAPAAAPAGGSTSGRTVAPARRRTAVWAIALVAVVAIIALLGWFVIRPLAVRSGVINDPGGTSTREVCPPIGTETPTLPPQGSDGRVHGGPLSYPRLGDPWSAPMPEGQVAFGRDVVRQQIEIESDPDWLAGVFVGRLVAGDGFFTPEEGSKIVVECITGTFYGNNPVTRADTRNTAVKVDGKDAWLLETQLSFDITGVEAKSEWLMVVIVAVGDGTAGLFFASVPENATQYIAPAKQAYAKLTVTS